MGIRQSMSVSNVHGLHPGGDRPVSIHGEVQLTVAARSVCCNVWHGP